MKKIQFQNQKARRNERGMTLVVPLMFFLLIAGLVAGSSMMVANRYKSVDAYLKLIRVQTAASSLLQIGVLKLTDYVKVQGLLPDQPMSNQIAADVYSNWFRNWYRKNFDDYVSSAGLHNYVDDLTLNTFEIKLISGGGLGDLSATYLISANMSYGTTDIKAAYSQRLTIENGRLLRFFAFYDLPLEIHPGPDLTVKGPVFSNDDIYIMPSRDNSMTFTGFSLANRDKIPFLLQSHKAIWFYFRRFLGPARYGPGTEPVPGFNARMQSVGQLQEFEAGVTGRPMYYYAKANIDMGASNSDTNWLYVDSLKYDALTSSPGVAQIQLSPRHPGVILNGGSSTPGGAAHYTDAYPPDTIVNISSIYNPAIGISNLRAAVGLDVTLWNPYNPRWQDVIQLGGLDYHFCYDENGNICSNSSTKRNYIVGDNAMTANEIPEILISVGASDGDNHSIIDPIENQDTPSVKRAKLQSKANINIDFRDYGTGLPTDPLRVGGAAVLRIRGCVDMANCANQIDTPFSDYITNVLEPLADFYAQFAGIPPVTAEEMFKRHDAYWNFVWVNGNDASSCGAADRMTGCLDDPGDGCSMPIDMLCTDYWAPWLLVEDFLNNTCTASPCSEAKDLWASYSNAFQNGTLTLYYAYGGNGFLTINSSTADFRCGENNNTFDRSMCIIDMEKMMSGIAAGSYIDQQNPTPQTLTPDDPIIFYFNGRRQGLPHCNTLQIENAEKLPKSGFTLVTPGRLRIKAGPNQGYNIFDYRFGRLCQTQDTNIVVQDDNGNFVDCAPPPAAILSDSFVALSRDWKDYQEASESWLKPPNAGGGSYNSSDYENHRVGIGCDPIANPGCDATFFNTAVITGHTPSSVVLLNNGLPEVPGFSHRQFGYSMRPWANFESFMFGTIPPIGANPSRTRGPLPYGTTDTYFHLDPDLVRTIPTFTDVADIGCQRTSGPLTVDQCNTIPILGVDYDSDGQTSFISAYDTNGDGVVTLGEMGGCGAGSNLKLYNLIRMREDGQTVWTPFTLPNSRAFLYRGERFAHLMVDDLYGWDMYNTTSSPGYRCDGCPNGQCGGSECTAEPVWQPGGISFNAPGCSKEAPQMIDTNGDNVPDTWIGAVVRYARTAYNPVYEARYSGGLSNLVQFIEDWREYDSYNHSVAASPTGSTRKFFLKGTLTSLWDSKNLVQLSSGGQIPCYWREKTYAAPERNFLFDQTLQDNSPPGVPGTFSIKIEDFDSGAKEGI